MSNKDILYDRHRWTDKETYIAIRAKIFAKYNKIEMEQGIVNAIYDKEFEKINKACEFNMGELIEELKIALPNAKVEPEISKFMYMPSRKPASQHLGIYIVNKKKRDDGYEYIQRTKIYDQDRLSEDQISLYNENPELLSDSVNDLIFNPYMISFDKATVMPDLDLYGEEVEDILMDKLLENYLLLSKQDSITYLSDKGKITPEAMNEYKKLREVSNTMPKQTKETKRFTKLAQRWAERNNEF